VTVSCRLKLRGGRTVVTDAAGRLVDGEPRPDPVLIKALKTAHRLLAEHGEAAIAAQIRRCCRPCQSSPTNAACCGWHF
jgi:hypothetical protein